MKAVKKWVLVTGGSRGIGRSVVEALAKEYVVIFTWRDREQAAQEVMQNCASLAGGAVGYACDGSQPEQVEALAKQLTAEYGAPWAIVHNAGITGDALHMNQTSENWLHVMNTNLNAILYWNRFLLPAMVMQGEGAVVLMSSVSAIKGNSGQTAYSATKAGMIGIGRSLAHEVGRFNIRVNSVAPGLIESEMLEKMPDAKRSAMLKQIPLKRAGKPEDVAAAVSFLISDASAWITGQTLVVDGGMTA